MSVHFFGGSCSHRFLVVVSLWLSHICSSGVLSLGLFAHLHFGFLAHSYG